MSRPGRTGHHGQLVAAYTGPTGFRQSGEVRRKIRKTAISYNIKPSQLPRIY